MARETINGISVPIPGTGEPADFVGDLRQIATDLPASIAEQVGLAEYGQIVAKPAAFPGITTRNITVRRLGTSRFVSDYDINDDRPATGVTYYASPSGTYGAAGTSGAPTSWSGAHDKSDVGTVYLKQGEYFADQTDKLVTKSLNVLPDPANTAPVYFTGFANPANLTWTLHSGNVYKATHATNWGNGAQWVIDKRPAHLTAWNDHATYTKVASVAAVDAPGKWFYDSASGGSLYVWALGNANLATDASFIRASKAGFTGFIINASPIRLYVEGFEIQGCGWAAQNLNAVGAFSSGNNATYLGKNMRIRYCPLSGWGPKNYAWSAAVNIEVSSCGGDGLNYQPGGTLGEFYEEGCYGHHLDNFTPAAPTLNATTSHDQAVGVRLHARAFKTYGPGIVDVNGAKTWNLGCESRDSTPTSTYAYAAAGFQVYGSGPGESVYGRMWLDSCDASGNFKGYNVLGNATLYISNQGPGSNNTNRVVESSGVIVDY